MEPLEYQRGQTCGTLTVYRDGPRIHLVAGPEPIHWRTVVQRTLKWALFSAILALAISVPAHPLSWIVFAVFAKWSFATGRRYLATRGVSKRYGPQFIAEPSGLTWITLGSPEPVRFAADAVAAVKLHLSPPNVRRTHPVSAVLVLVDGSQRVLGSGTMDECELIISSIEEGLRMDQPTPVAEVALAGVQA